MGPEGDLVAARLARGCRCFAVWMDGQVAGYGWLSTGPEWIGELGLEIRPPVGEAYIWNCVTLPAHRLRGKDLRLLLLQRDAEHLGGLVALGHGVSVLLGVLHLDAVRA